MPTTDAKDERPERSIAGEEAVNFLNGVYGGDNGRHLIEAILKGLGPGRVNTQDICGICTLTIQRSSDGTDASYSILPNLGKKKEVEKYMKQGAKLAKKQEEEWWSGGSGTLFKRRVRVRSR
jgi:hypothetical protein